MNSELKEGDKVVRLDGTWRGRKAEVLYVYPVSEFKGWMQIMYSDDETDRTYDAKCINFVLLSEWKKTEHRPYKPRQVTVTQAIKDILTGIFEIEGIEGEYTFLYFSWVDPKILKRMEGLGLIERVGRFIDLLNNKELEWKNCTINYLKVAHDRKLWYNVVVYAVKNQEGIEAFVWK